MVRNLEKPYRLKNSARYTVCEQKIYTPSKNPISFFVNDVQINERSINTSGSISYIFTYLYFAIIFY